MSRRGWILFIALCVIWGIPFLFTRIAVREVPPPTLVFLRSLPAALLLVPLLFGQRTRATIAGHWLWMTVWTITQQVVPWLLLAHAQERISSSLTGLLVAAVPLLAAVLVRSSSAAEAYDRRRIGGLFLGFAGVAALIGLDFGSSDIWAVAEVLLVALLWAFGPTIVSSRLGGVSPVTLMTFAMAVGAIVFAPTIVLWPPRSISWAGGSSILVLSLVCSALAIVVYVALVREVGPSRTTVVGYLNPVVAVLLGVGLLHEPFTLGIAVGMPLVLLGSVLATAPTAATAGGRPRPNA